MPLKIDALPARFSELLRENGTTMENPALGPTWRAFVALCRESVECDEERLFFEVDLSSTHADSLYLHFSRTCYGREPKGHLWSYEVICDFLFDLDDELEEFQCSLEAEELGANDPQREQFLNEANAQKSLWKALEEHEPSEAQIYLGES